MAQEIAHLREVAELTAVGAQVREIRPLKERVSVLLRLTPLSTSGLGLLGFSFLGGLGALAGSLIGAVLAIWWTWRRSSL